MSMVYPIETLEDLGNLFRNTSYSKPSNFFYNLKDQTVKKYIPDGYMIEVSALIIRKMEILTGLGKGIQVMSHFYSVSF